MLRIVDADRSVSTSIQSQAKEAVRLLFDRKDLGFFDLPHRNSNWALSQLRASEIRSKFDKMVVLGIGGSSLGGRALFQALQDSLKAEVEFFENVDAVSFWRKVKSLRHLEKTHFVIVSKSGTTVETLSQAEFLNQHWKELKLDFSKQCTVVSESKESPLTSWAKTNSVPVLEIPLDVGGRFSILTPVGLLPAAFAGLNIEQVREGAHWALNNKELVKDLVAHSLLSWQKQEWLTLFWTYCDDLKDYGLWIQQLWAESLAKKKDRSGADGPRVSVPIPLVGANDQHSVLQQVVEGYKDKFVWFMRVKKSEEFGPQLKENMFNSQKFMLNQKLGALLSAEASATQKALLEYGISSLALEVEVLDEKTMGALFMTLELVVGALGEALGINAFDQPGVELGKRLARQILEKR